MGSQSENHIYIKVPLKCQLWMMRWHYFHWNMKLRWDLLNGPAPFSN